MERTRIRFATAQGSFRVQLCGNMGKPGRLFERGPVAACRPEQFDPPRTRMASTWVWKSRSGEFSGRGSNYTVTLTTTSILCAGTVAIGLLNGIGIDCGAGIDRGRFTVGRPRKTRITAKTTVQPGRGWPPPPRRRLLDDRSKGWLASLGRLSSAPYNADVRRLLRFA